MSDQLLLHAVRQGDCDEVAYLLEEDRADVTVKGGSGNSLVHIAVESGNLTCVKLLLEYKADPDIKGPAERGGYTPLHIAAQNDSWKIIQLLLGANVDINAKSSSLSTPLIEAVKFGRKNTVAVLLKRGNISEPGETRCVS